MEAIDELDRSPDHHCRPSTVMWTVAVRLQRSEFTTDPTRHTTSTTSKNRSMETRSIRNEPNIINCSRHPIDSYERNFWLKCQTISIDFGTFANHNVKANKNRNMRLVNSVWNWLVRSMCSPVNSTMPICLSRATI